MKKVFLVTILSVFGFLATQAQVKPSFGFKAGLNFPKIEGDNVESENSNGFHAGLVLHIPIKKLGVQAEALYSKEGDKDIDLNYVNVPILLTYKILPGLRFHLGPQFKVKVNAKADFEGLDVAAEEKFEDDINSFNFDGAVGLEYKLPVIGIFAQARYNFALSDTFDSELGSAKQNVFQLSVGYRF